MNPRQCLEDGLNSAAVVRTTFETLDLFPPASVAGAAAGVISQQGNARYTALVGTRAFMPCLRLQSPSKKRVASVAQIASLPLRAEKRD